MINQCLIERIKHEIKDDRRTYLENCKKNYTDYVQAAQIVFRDYYQSIGSASSRIDAYTRYNLRAIKCKGLGDIEGEKQYLQKAIENNVDTPYPYERLAILHSKEREFDKAFSICSRWFNSPFWKIPNMATSSLRILDRMEKLEKKMTKKQ